MSRRIVLAAVIALVAIASAAAVAVTRPGSAVLTAAPPTIAAATIENCRHVADGNAANDNAITECIVNLLAPAAEAAGLTSVNTTLSAPVDDPRYRNACHEAAHTLGKRQVDDFASVADVIPLRLFACEGGLMHGVFDAAAVAGISDDDLKKAIVACEREPDRVYCADGLGHMVWTTTQDFTAATAKCQWFGDVTEAVRCIEGILMRMSAPQAGTGTRKYSTAEIADTCTSTSEIVRRACAPQLAFAAVNDELIPVIAAVAPVGLDESGLPGMAAGLDTTDALCDQLGDQWGPVCRMEVGNLIQRRFRGFDLGLALVCSRLPQDQWARCASGQPMEGGPAIVDLAVVERLAANPPAPVRAVTGAGSAGQGQPAD